MTEKQNSIRDYLVEYVPKLIGRNLAHHPVPDMAGTLFTLQITIEGERSLTFGITFKDAAEMTVTEGPLPAPMVSLRLSEDIVRPIVKLASSLTGRKQYDTAKNMKGAMQAEIDMPGGWKLPFDLAFNGASEPSFKLNATLEDMAQMARGEVDPTQAFMQGKLKITGDIALALALSQFMAR
jgi:hypothetical protein